MSESGEILPLWYLDHGRALFAGPLGWNASHRHSVPVFLGGLYGAFVVRIDGGAWQRCRTAVIPPGVPYEFDMEGAPLAVLYMEPGHARVEYLARLLCAPRDVHGALVSDGGEISVLREIYEDRDSRSWVPRALNDLMGFSAAGSGPIDPRVSRAMEALRADYANLRSVAMVAESAGLSPSRFQHVFTQEVGVPFRRPTQVR